MKKISIISALVITFFAVFLILKKDESFYQLNSSQVIVTENMQSAATTYENLQTQLENAFSKKHPDFDMNGISLVVEKTDGNYVKGMVVPNEPNGSGGIFFAVKTHDKWIIASDGNGVVFCSEIEMYNFPASLIPQCFNTETSEIISRH